MWVALIDFTSRSNVPERQRECNTVEEMMKTCRELVQGVINERNRLKEYITRSAIGSLWVIRCQSHLHHVIYCDTSASQSRSCGSPKEGRMERRMAEIEAQLALLLEQKERRKWPSSKRNARKRCGSCVYAWSKRQPWHWQKQTHWMRKLLPQTRFATHGPIPNQFYRYVNTNIV